LTSARVIATEVTPTRLPEGFAHRVRSYSDDTWP
jgi:hypothetical protein